MRSVLASSVYPLFAGPVTDARLRRPCGALGDWVGEAQLVELPSVAAKGALDHVCR